MSFSRHSAFSSWFSSCQLSAQPSIDFPNRFPFPLSFQTASAVRNLLLPTTRNQILRSAQDDAREAQTPRHFGLFAPYFDLPCFRFATPTASSVPRIT